MTFKKITAALALLLTSATISACSDNNETTSECEEGQVKAQVGDAEAQCYTSCSSDDDCGDGESCTSSLCIADGGTNPDDDMDVVVDGDMGDDMTPVVEEDMGDDMDVIVDEDMNDMGDVVADANPGTACADASACMGTEAACITEADQGFPAGYCTSSCTSDAQCGSTGVCLIDDTGGLCLASCDSDANCREGYTCQNVNGVQACFPAPPDYGTVGSTCTPDDVGAAAECGEDGSCIGEDNGFPGGYCIGECTGAPSVCPDGTQCVTGFGDGTNNFDLCLDGCSSAADCRDGYACANLDDDGFGECWPTNTEGEAPGAACAADANGMGGKECLGLNGQCLDPSSGIDFPEVGYCISQCDFAGDCIDGAHCTENLFNIPVCLQDCATDADCGAGLTCQDANGDSVNECMPTPVSADGDGVPGDACTDTATDCAGGALGQCFPADINGDGDVDFADGYCTVRCDNDPSVCVDGSHCAANGLCVDECAADADCRTGYACQDIDGDSVNECWPTADGQGTPGDACDFVADCSGGADGTCLPEDIDGDGNPDFTDGYCTIDCSVTACPTGSSCQEIFVDANQNPLPFCFGECVGGNAGDCRSGYSCVVLSGGGLAAAAQGETGFCFQ